MKRTVTAINARPDTTEMDLERNAYNVAFSELGLTWFWDAATYAQLRATAVARDPVHCYLEAHHSHLLSAYDSEFLVRAVEAKRVEVEQALRQERPVTPARLDLQLAA